MTLPKLYYISQGKTDKEHLENIQQACVCGVEMVQLRLKNSSEKRILKIAHQAREITDHFQTRLVINDFYKVAKEVKADGVHVGKNDGDILAIRKYLSSWQCIGGTATNLEEAKLCVVNLVDYIGLGAYKNSKTKNVVPPFLGNIGYELLLEALATELPIYAVGGVELNDVPALLQTGIYGVAVSNDLTLDFNKISRYHQVLQSAATQEQLYKF